MQNIIYDIHSKSPLIVGYVEETEAREVEFRGFTQERTDTLVYINIDGIGRRALLNYKLPISSIYTKSKGTYEAYLVELKIDTDDETILYARKSNNFDLIIKHSAKMSDLLSEETDELDDWFSAMGTLYNTVQTKLQNGELKGDKGEKGDTGNAGQNGSDGADGFSPTVTTSKTGKTTTITITDKNGTRTATVLDGNDGNDGADGNDGTSISITNVSESTASGGTSTVTFSDGNTLSVKNGINGVDGSNGRDGSDAEVTSQNIANALGYTPADEDDVEQLNDDLANKITKPNETPTVGKILKIKSVNDDGTFVCEWGDAPSGGSTDVQINGTSITEDGVANIPYASKTVKGLLQIGNGFNSIQAENGILAIAAPSTYGLNLWGNELGLARTSFDAIDNRSINDIMAVNIGRLDYAVKAAMCDGKGADWTVSEQNKALARLNAVCNDYQSVTEYTLDSTYDEKKNYTINLENSAKRRILVVIKKDGAASGDNNYLKPMNGNTAISAFMPCYFSTGVAFSVCEFEKINDNLTKYMCFCSTNGYTVYSKIGIINGNIADISKFDAVANGSNAILGSGTKFTVCID